MKDTILQNHRLRVAVNALGAELKSLELDGREFLWQGDAAHWLRTAPTMFPIVGRFLSDTYYVGDTPYHMTINGFGMDRNFALTEASAEAATFRLAADAQTLGQYPYPFQLDVTYRLRETALETAYTIVNPGSGVLPFAVGGHTGYRWGKDEQATLRFEQPETLESFNPFGWRQPFLRDTDTLTLERGMFRNGPRSLAGLRSAWVELTCGQRRVRVDRQAFPYLVLWMLPDAEFLCMEPCTSVHSGDHGALRLEDRDGMTILPPGRAMSCQFTIHASVCPVKISVHS